MSPTSFTADSNDYATERVFTVTTVDDEDVQNAAVTITISGGGLTAEVPVTVIDDDVLAFRLSTNAINGNVSPEYYRAILGWRHQHIWESAVAQGLLEGGRRPSVQIAGSLVLSLRIRSTPKFPSPNN